jgi:hypothetical protein
MKYLQKFDDHFFAVDIYKNWLFCYIFNFFLIKLNNLKGIQHKIIK